MVAYKEQCQQAIGTWAGKAKVAYWSASGTWAGKAKVTYWYSLDEEAGTHALHEVQRQVLQRVGSRAHAVRTVEEQRSMLQKVQRQVLQQVSSKAQAVRAVEEEIEASRRQQVRQGEETAAPQETDRSPETAAKEGSQLGERLGRRGNEPKVEQGLHREAILRWLTGVQGEGTWEAAAGMLGPEEVEGDAEAQPQYETNTVAYNSGPETTEESHEGDSRR